MQTSWRPFVWVSAALCIGTMGTALASPLHPLYQVLWDLQPSEITYIFIASAWPVSPFLLGLGRVIIGKITTNDNRGPILSSLLFVGYLGTILPIVSVGLLADTFGLITAVIIFCLSMSLLALGLVLYKVRLDRRSA
jgi:hypothetical protein